LASRERICPHKTSAAWWDEQRDELSREVGVVGLEFAEMLGESREFCCEDVETVGGERLGLFEGGLEGGVAEGDDNDRGFFGV